MNFKKIKAGLLAGFLSISFISMFSTQFANATGYDTNNDGTVTLADAVYLSRYLCGQFSVTSPIALDVTGEGMIDGTDVQCILYYCVSSSFSWNYV